MCAIKIDSGDMDRRTSQIAHHIAATRSDGHDVVPWFERHRFHVDIGIFPDLRIDEAAKDKRK